MQKRHKNAVVKNEENEKEKLDKIIEKEKKYEKIYEENKKEKEKKRINNILKNNNSINLNIMTDESLIKSKKKYIEPKAKFYTPKSYILTDKGFTFGHKFYNPEKNKKNENPQFPLFADDFEKILLKNKKKNYVSTSKRFSEYKSEEIDDKIEKKINISQEKFRKNKEKKEEDNEEKKDKKEKEKESERKISEEEGKKCCKDNDFYCFCETSAKTGFNSQEIFIKALKLLYINHQKYKSGEVGEQAAKEISNKKLGKELLEREKKKKKKNSAKKRTNNKNIIKEKQPFTKRDIIYTKNKNKNKSINLTKEEEKKYKKVTNKNYKKLMKTNKYYNIKNKLQN